MAPRRAFKKKAKASRPKTKKVAKLSSPMRRAVKQLVRGEAETKTASFYQDANNGSITTPATGIFANRGWALQNSVISSNNTDLLQLIPNIQEGTDDWERIGKSIRVVNLNVKGTVRISFNLLNNIGTPGTNLNVYMYFLQHVSLKDYDSLRSQNDFTQLLDNNEGTVVQFLGNALDGFMPVSEQYYKVLTRRKLVLKYGGAVLPGGTLTTPVSVANAHHWSVDYNIDLTKHIPKRLIYPERNQAVGSSQFQPTNSSIFMCMGFVDELVPNPSASLVRPWLEQTYVSKLSFKDM